MLRDVDFVYIFTSKLILYSVKCSKDTTIAATATPPTATKIILIMGEEACISIMKILANPFTLLFVPVLDLWHRCFISGTMIDFYCRVFKFHWH